MLCEFMLIEGNSFNWEKMNLKKQQENGKEILGKKKCKCFYLDSFKVIWGDVSFENIL